MATRHLVLQAAAVAVLGLALPGCFDEPGLNPQVFTDSFVDNQYQRFGTALGDLSIDPAVKFSGFASIKVTIPSDGCQGADTTHFCYAGGALVASTPRDLSKYNALTFYAKASTEAAIDSVGLGNDNTGASKFTVTWNKVAVTTRWTKYYLPIPVPAKLVSERGLFFFSASNLGGTGYTLWIDAIQFENVSAIGPARPVIPSGAVNRKTGSSIAVSGGTVTYAINDVDQTMVPALSYFDFASSNPAVATIGQGGTGAALAVGKAQITATMGGVPADGALTVVVPGVAVDGSTVLAVSQPVFTDDLIGVDFQAFGNALGTIALDSTQMHSGAKSLRIDVPSNGCPGSDGSHFCYAGGAFVAGTPQDLSFFNALTFFAKASSPAAKLAVAGLGNDNSGSSRYTATITNQALTTDWVKYFVPIPLAAKLSNERGLFFFAANTDGTGGVGYAIYLDDMQLEGLPSSVLDPAQTRPAFPDTTVNKTANQTFGPPPTSVTFKINGADLTVAALPSYFTWSSDNTAAATVGSDGSGATIGPGTAHVSARLGVLAASGTLTVNVH